MRLALLVDPAVLRDPTPALRAAAALARRGHDVTVVATADLPLDGVDPGALRFVRGATAATVPAADLLVATSPATIELAVAARRGPVARYVTEADPQPGRPVPCIVAGDAARVARIAHGEVHEIGWVVDERTFHADAEPREPAAPARVGVAGGDLAAVRAALDAAGVAAVVTALDRDPAPGTDAARAAVLRGLDVLVVADGTPGTTFEPRVAEALACGVPSVLADVPAVRAATGPRNDVALFVAADDAAGCAEGVAFVVRHRRLRVQLRAAALEVARQHGHDRHVDELERAVARIVARAQQTGAAAPPQRNAEAAGDGDLVRVLALRAQQHVEGGELAAATTCLDAAMAFLPDSALLWTQMADVRLRAGDPAAALAAVEHALDAGGTSCRLHEIRAAALSGLARPSDATRALTAAARCEDATADTFRALAERLRADGDLRAARIAEREAAVRAACG